MTQQCCPFAYLVFFISFISKEGRQKGLDSEKHWGNKCKYFNVVLNEEENVVDEEMDDIGIQKALEYVPIVRQV